MKQVAVQVLQFNKYKTIQKNIVLMRFVDLFYKAKTAMTNSANGIQRVDRLSQIIEVLSRIEQRHVRSYKSEANLER